METQLKTRVLIISGVLLTTMCMSAFGNGWNGQQITMSVMHGKERTVITRGLYGPGKNPDQCDVDTLAILHPDIVGPASYKETYALLLGAHLTGREINIYSSGCVTLGTTTYPSIAYINVY